MIRIQSITLREIRLRLKEPFQISSGFQHERRILLLQLEDAEGVEAWSECVAGSRPNYSPETIETAWVALSEWVIPRVLNETFGGPTDVHHVLQKDIRGHNMAKAAVEMAAWAMAAQKRDISLANLLGGTRDHIATGISLGIQETPQKLVEKVRDSLAHGYRKIKIKIKPGCDIKYIAAVREEFGPEAPLMVDANNAYSLDDIDLLKQLDKFGLIMIEQPLAWDDIVKHATLQKQLQTPICLDESITSVSKAEDMVALGSGKIINIKPGRVGGFWQSKAIHDFCSQQQIPVWCGGMLESGIGRGYNVALASLPNFVIPGDLSPSNRYWEQDIVNPEWSMDQNGQVKVPFDKTGIGVEIDRDRIEDLTVKIEKFPKPQ